MKIINTSITYIDETDLLSFNRDTDISDVKSSHIRDQDLVRNSPVIIFRRSDGKGINNNKVLKSSY